MMWWLEDIKVA